MSNKKLLPCPMCGEKFCEGVIAYHPASNCMLAHIGFKKTRKNIELWNTRVPMQKIVERLEKESDTLMMARWELSEDMYKDKTAYEKVQELLLEELMLSKAIDIVKKEGM